MKTTGFTKSNSFTLGLLTMAFVIGEISHFLIGVVRQDMARSIHFGDKSCLEHSNASLRHATPVQLFVYIFEKKIHI